VKRERKCLENGAGVVYGQVLLSSLGLRIISSEIRITVRCFQSFFDNHGQEGGRWKRRGLSEEIADW
jgi:hypothetical protein